MATFFWIAGFMLLGIASQVTQNTRKLKRLAASIEELRESVASMHKDLSADLASLSSQLDTVAEYSYMTEEDKRASREEVRDLLRP